MPRKRPYVDTPDAVRIRREGDVAVLTYKDASVATVHLKVGPSLGSMTDADVLALHNRVLLAQERRACEREYVAIEIPAGRPQVTYTKECDQWVPRGSVLRCVVHDGGPDGEATVEIDDHELSLEQFGRLLTFYAGWGMRILFVPREETGNSPAIEVRDVKDGEPVCTERPRRSSLEEMGG